MRCLWLIRQKVFKRLLRVPGWKGRSGRQELSCGKWTVGVDEMGPKCGRDREHQRRKATATPACTERERQRALPGEEAGHTGPHSPAHGRQDKACEVSQKKGNQGSDT